MIYIQRSIRGNPLLGPLGPNQSHGAMSLDAVNMSVIEVASIMICDDYGAGDC